MTAIIRYILNMLPYMLLTIPFYLIARVVIIKKSAKKINWYHEVALLLFTLFAIGLASQTVIPKIEFGVTGLGIVKSGVHQTNLIPLKVLFETYREVFVNGYINYFIINFLGNIIMFMPIGFFVPLLWNVPGKRTIFIGFCSSLFVEVSQLFLARGTDVDDLILNTLGVWLGLVLYKVLYNKFKDFTLKFR